MTPSNLQAPFEFATDVLAALESDLTAGTPRVRYPSGVGELAHIELGPKQVTLIGGSPGIGKTALVMQLVIDALRLNPDVTSLVCNVEMPACDLLERQIARLSGVDLSSIRNRQLSPEILKRVEVGITTLKAVTPRLGFVNSPYSMEQVLRAAQQLRPHIVVLDYLQRIPCGGGHADRRGSVDSTMELVRGMANTGIAVIVVSALARTKDKSGRSCYHGDGLGLASFRESSELEYGADDAYLIISDDSPQSVVTLRHLKARHSELRNLMLAFNGRVQQFTSFPNLVAGPEEQSSIPPVYTGFFTP